MRTVERVIAHLDMDAFYAAVEVREYPSLLGKPLIIGHRGRRGVVSTCSYEARRFGVRSAMPSVVADRLCPQATWLHGRMSLYVSVSREIRRILGDFSPVIEPLSIDEAFIDLSGIARDLDHGAEIAHRIKQRILDEQHLTASVGLAPNKFLAKVASDMDKPDGLVLLPLDAVPRLLWPLPIERLWGVGPRTAERLYKGGVKLIGDLTRLDLTALEPLVGPNQAAHLQSLAHGRDSRRVSTDRKSKSISEERTYGDDLTDPDEIDRALLARAEGVARQLRRQRLVAHTVHIKVRAGDFTTWTRSHTLPDPTDLVDPILDAARTMYRDRIRLAGRGVRLLGLGVSHIEPASEAQPTLFTPPDEQRARRLARASDAVKNKLGESSLTRARLLRRKRTDDGSVV